MSPIDLNPNVIVLLLVVILFAAGSFAIWAEITRRLAVETPVVPRYDHGPVDWNRMVVVAAVIVIGVLVWASYRSPSGEKPDLQTLQWNAAINLGILGVLLLMLSEAGRKPLSMFGITWKNWQEQLPWGFWGFLASLVPVYMVIVMTLPFRSLETQHPFLKLIHEQPGVELYAWITVTAVVLAPFYEELLFRVILQGALQSRFSPAVAIGTSSVIFAGVHGVPDSLPLLPLALILGYVYYRRHSYAAVVLLHALFNAFNLLLSQFSLFFDLPESQGSVLLR